MSFWRVPGIRNALYWVLIFDGTLNSTRQQLSHNMLQLGFTDKQWLRHHQIEDPTNVVSDYSWTPCMFVLTLTEAHYGLLVMGDAVPCHATIIDIDPIYWQRCHAMPCHAMPCHAMPCHAMPCQATIMFKPHILKHHIPDLPSAGHSRLYYTILYYTVLYYTILYYTILCFIVI